MEEKQIEKLSEFNNQEFSGKFKLDDPSELSELLQLYNRKYGYYDSAKIDKTGASYRVIIGERSNGKTYSILKRIIQNYTKTGRQGVYLRRWSEDIKGARASLTYSGVASSGAIEKITHGKWTGVFYYASAWYLSRQTTEKGKTKTVHDKTPFCFAMSLSDMEHNKSVSYENVQIICFDEFISRIAYIPDEFIIFQNTLSTIIRQKTDVVVYMLGNTVSKVCPYFREMGLSRIKKQKQGTIDIYEYGKDGLTTVAVEYCSQTKITSKTASKYYGFDNPGLKMIKSGVWEVANHPHLPREYWEKKKPEEVYTFYVKYDGEVLEVRLLVAGDESLLFVNPKTTPLQENDDDLIYTDEYRSEMNIRRSIFRDNSFIACKIKAYITSGRVYFSDNETGEVWENYLKWARQN